MSLSEMLEAARVALGKRKEQERELCPVPVPVPAAPGATAKAELSSKPGSSNMLLAGNLAHEFLTHGTVLGRRIEATSTVPGRRVQPTWQPARPEPEPEPEPEPKRRYAEMSWLLMANGAHIPDVVNPTQLGRWLHIKD